LAFSSTSPLANGVANVAYNVTVTATGGNTPYTFSATGLPGGLSISSGGVISGTPTAAGTSTAAITVKDSTNPQQSLTQNFTITIIPALSITTASPLAGGTVNSAYSTTIQATGGLGPYTFTAPSVPAGLTLSSGGVLSGTPTAAGTSTIAVTAKDSGNPQQTVNANLAITISLPVGTSVTIAPVSVGQGLQTVANVSISAAQASDLTFTLSTSDATKLMINGGGAGVVSSISATIPAGFTSIGINVIGVATGSTTLVASGNATGSGAATITPSGFVMFGPGQQQSFTLNQGQQATLTIEVAQLDASGNVLSTNQPIAPPVPPAVSHNVAVILNNQSPTVGSLAASVTFTPGDFTHTATFTAINTGSSSAAGDVLTANPPANFIAPISNQNIVTATVNAIGCSLPTAGVGRNLQTSTASDGVSDYSVSLSGTVPGNATCNTGSGLCVTISSTDTSKFLLSADGSTAPSPSITVVAPVAGNRTPKFFVVGVGTGTLGSAAINVNAGTFGTCSANATLNPSGFVISASSQLLTGSTTVGASQQANLTVFSAELNSSNAFVAFQPIAAGTPTVTVNTTNSNSGAGTVSSSVAFAAGTVSQTATFTAGNSGASTNIGVTQPSSPVGFSTPISNASVAVTVQAISFGMCGDAADIGQLGPLPVGYHLQVPCAVSISQPAPSALTVTLTATNGNLLLSNDPTGTTAGSSTTTVTIAAGATFSNQYFIQVAGCPVVQAGQPMCGGANSTTATYTASTSGFANFNDSGTITLVPSTLFVASSVSVTAGSTMPVTIDTAATDPNDPTNFNLWSFGQSFAALPGSATLPLSVDTGNHSKATVTSPTLTGGNASISATLTGVASGSTTVTVATPTNFATNPFQTANVTVF
jgi:hypothetical protein